MPETVVSKRNYMKGDALTCHHRIRSHQESARRSFIVLNKLRQNFHHVHKMTANKNDLQFYEFASGRSGRLDRMNGVSFTATHMLLHSPLSKLSVTKIITEFKTLENIKSNL